MHSSRQSTLSDCNTTHSSNENQIEMPGNCNGLMQRTVALTRDKQLLENLNTELNNRIKMVEEERERFRMQLSGEYKMFCEC